jgi:hypothetical protein
MGDALALDPSLHGNGRGPRNSREESATWGSHLNTPWEIWSLGAGVGTNGSGPEWAANARLRPVWWRTPNGSFFHALTLEGSVSRATENSGFVLFIDDSVDTSVVRKPSTGRSASSDGTQRVHLSGVVRLRQGDRLAALALFRIRCSLRASAAAVFRSDVRARSGILVVRQVLRRADQTHNAQ